MPVGHVERVIPQNNVIMIVQVGMLYVDTVIASKIEPHIIEHVSRLYVDLHLRRREAVHKPIECVVLPYAVIDKLGVFARDSGYTERLARSIVLQHFNLKKT
jgi:hypothetical protein